MSHSTYDEDDTNLIKHYRDVIKDMRLLPLIHPENYVQLVEARMYIMIGDPTSALEALCNISEPVDDLIKQYRGEIAEEIYRLLPWSKTDNPQNNQYVLAIISYYVQSSIKHASEPCVKDFLRVLEKHVILQTKVFSASQKLDPGNVEENIEELRGHINTFNQESQDFSLKERSLLDVASRLLENYSSYGMAADVLAQDLSHALAAVDLHQGSSPHTLFGGTTAHISDTQQVTEHTNHLHQDPKSEVDATQSPQP
jgi:hypothetical protein